MLHGTEVIYVPAALVLLAILVAVCVHAAVSWLLTSPDRDGVTQVIATASVLAGLLLIGRALVGMLVPAVSASEFPGTTALSLSLGPVLAGYGVRIAAAVAERKTAVRPGPGRFTEWYRSRLATRLRAIALAATAGLVIAGSFWAAHSFAWAFGAGRGYHDALTLEQRPEVVVDTAEPLTDLPPGVTGARLPPGAGSSFHYRYRGLRLLVQAHERLFLVPGQWTPTSWTLILPYDSTVRIQLIPQN